MRRGEENTAEAFANLPLGWYAVALAGIALLLWASLSNVLPPLFAVIALFALFFWLFSLIFALYGKFKYRRTRRP